MSSEEEQLEEIEVLESIYCDEYELISGSPLRTFKIHIAPNPGGEGNFVAAALVVKLPKDYPLILPEISIEIEKGLNKRNADKLKEIAEEMAEELLGTPSIFAMSEAIKEWLCDNNQEGQDGSMYADMMKRMSQKTVESQKKADKAAHIAAADNENITKELNPEEEARIRARQAGTQVTVESFNKWKESFDAEMHAKVLTSTGGKDLTADLSAKISGKQLFTTGKAGLDDNTDEEGTIDESEVSENIFKFGKSIEGEEEDDDDDDDSDEDYAEEEDDDDDEDYEDGDD
jgi:hypothetical protein